MTTHALNLDSHNDNRIVLLKKVEHPSDYEEIVKRMEIYGAVEKVRQIWNDLDGFWKIYITFESFDSIIKAVNDTKLYDIDKNIEVQLISSSKLSKSEIIYQKK